MSGTRVLSQKVKTPMSSYAELVIARRFNGPPVSANGGYVSGSLASLLLDALRNGGRDGAGTGDGVVQVTLRKPPPLETPMLVSDDRTTCTAGGETVLEARLVEDGIEPVEPVSYDDALAATTRFDGLRSHPFPSCFTCGTERAEGDGLRIFTGMVDDDRAAGVWTPHESVAVDGRVPEPVTWAAIDCVSAWAGDLGNRPMVLGRMTCAVDAAPRAGEPHVVMGRLLGHDGRKTFALSTLYDSDGRIVARAGHVWFLVDPEGFGVT